MTRTKKQDITIALHEERLKNLSENVEKIMTNHLPHIQDAIDTKFGSLSVEVNAIHRKLALWGGGIIVVGAFANTLIGQLFK